MTNKDNIEWHKLLDNLVGTVEHGNNNGRIVAATETLQQTAHQFVKVLNERARLLANNAQFEAASRDAAAIRALFPRSSLGYLCTGDVYCQQGYYAAAITIYDQGLKAVPETDPYYHQLQLHRITAVTNDNRRVDFITKLPLDVVITNIVPRINPEFFSESHCDILYVSRAWQERILKQPNGLAFKFDPHVTILRRGHDQLIKFAPYVRKLGGILPHNVHLDYLFSQANFSNLKHLDLSCSYNTRPYPFLKGLEVISGSLTHLTISACFFVDLSDILQSCPNLVSLKADGIDPVMPSSPSERFPNITHLSLKDASKPYFTNEEIVDILSRFPSLIWLELVFVNDSIVLPLLYELCPYLKILYYGCLGDFDHAADYIFPEGKGITMAHLRRSENFYQDDLIKFLFLYRHSLEELYIDGTIMMDDHALWKISNGRLEPRRNLQPLELDPRQSEPLFKELLDFCFMKFATPFDISFVQWSLLNVPNLDSVELDEAFFQPDISIAMMRLRHLSKLEINFAVGASGNVNTSIKQFLEHHIALRDDSRLKHIIVNTGRCMSKVDWIPLLARFKGLKKLELNVGTMTRTCSSILEDIGYGCPVLDELWLTTDDKKLHQGLLAPLRQFPSLKRFAIGVHTISNADLHFLASLGSLERLYLKTNVPDDILALLKSRIPMVLARCR